MSASIRVLCVEGPCPCVSPVLRSRSSLFLHPRLFFGSRPPRSRLISTRTCVISRQRVRVRTNTRHCRPNGRRGSYLAGPSRRNHPPECGYCGKYGHYEEECRKKARDSVSTGRQLTNYASNSDYDNASNSDDRGEMSMNHATDSDYDDRFGMFVMRHKAQSMMAQASTSASAPNNVRWLGCIQPHDIS